LVRVPWSDASARLFVERLVVIQPDAVAPDKFCRDAGQSLSGFGFQATFTPAQLAAAANSGVSDAYSGGLFSDAGQIFTVQPVAAPEPSGSLLMLSGSAILCFFGRDKFFKTPATSNVDYDRRWGSH